MATAGNLGWADRWPMSGSPQGKRKGAAPAAADAAVFDEDAFAAFYSRTATALWRYLRRASGDEARADDLLQESYVKFLGAASAASVPAGERQQTAYLYRIATNLLRDRWRRDQRQESWLERLFPNGPARGEGAARVDLKVDLDAVLGTLKPKQRALLWLAYVEGYDHREIAEILGLRAGSIRVLLFRARKKLAAALAERGLEDLPKEALS